MRVTCAALSRLSQRRSPAVGAHRNHTHLARRMMTMTMPNLIVFSHLRWNFVYQRPQHLMTRLAEHYRITFIEEPVFHEGESFLAIQDIGSNIRVARPHTP